MRPVLLLGEDEVEQAAKGEDDRAKGDIRRSCLSLGDEELLLRRSCISLGGGGGRMTSSDLKEDDEVEGGVATVVVLTREASR